MSKSLLGTLLGLAVAVLISFRWEGAQRFGVWSGYLLGAGVGCAILGWQAKAFRQTPHKAMQVLGLGFLLKVTAIGVMGLLIYSVPAIRERLDAMSFLIAAAGGMFLLMLLGTFENAKVLEHASREAYLRSQNIAKATQAKSDGANPSEALTEGTTSL